jgi:hypothetical protein
LTEPVIEENYVAPMTNFEMIAAEYGPIEQDPHFWGSMTDFDGYVGEGEYTPNMETTGILTYCVGAVLIFSVALAVARRQFNSARNRTNITKAVKKRFRNIVGSDPGHLNNASSREDQRDRFVEEETKHDKAILKNLAEDEERKIPEPLDSKKLQRDTNRMMDKVLNRFGLERQRKNKPEENTAPVNEEK